MLRKKICISIILMVVIILGYMSPVNAKLNGKIDLATSKTQYSKGSEVIVDVKLLDVSTDNGIVAFSAVLQYDKNSLQLIEMQGQNGWSSPKTTKVDSTYNSSTGDFLMDINEPVTESMTILKMKFKVLENSSNNIAITLKDASAANGLDAPITVATLTKKLTITSGTSSGNNGNSGSNGNEGSGSGNNSGGSTDSGNNGSGNTGSENNGSGNHEGEASQGGTNSGNTNNGTVTGTGNSNVGNLNTQAPGALPATGESKPIVLLAIASVIVIASIFILIKLKKTKKF